MTPDDSLLVAPPSTSGWNPGTGDVTKAPTGLPERSPRGVAGYNSTLLAICDAPRCGREFEVSAKSDDLPYHHAPGARGLLKPVCHGSGRRASVFVEPAKGA